MFRTYRLSKWWNKFARMAEHRAQSPKTTFHYYSVLQSFLCRNSQWSDNVRNEKQKQYFFVISISGFGLIGNTIPIVILHFNYLFDKSVFVYQIRFFRNSTTTKTHTKYASGLDSFFQYFSFTCPCHLPTFRLCFACISAKSFKIDHQKIVLLFSLIWFNWP